MLYALNDTHDPCARSWVEAANAPGCDFPIQNLPYGVFQRDEAPRIGVAIGDQVLDLAAACDRGLLDGLDSTVRDSLRQPALNRLMSLAPPQWSGLRRSVFELLREESGGRVRREVEKLLVPMSRLRMLLPVAVGDYTDFFASIYHATNTGRMRDPDHPLPENYHWMPLAYQGRASTIVLSGEPIQRPQGQLKPSGAVAPYLGRSRRLDYELEAAIYVGGGNRLGETIPIAEAEKHIFGVCLLNDWSARDVQGWEQQPLGPFLGKNFATTVSPWIVTLEALAPFRVPAASRLADDPPLLAYLRDEDDQQHGGIDLTLEVYLSTRRMREMGASPHRLSRSHFCQMYWTFAQMIAQHTINGCNLRPGDLLASGTASGPAKDSRGCLLELTWKGSEPIQLPSGELRRFLEDGDEVIMRGFCQREGAARIGLGECRGMVG